MKTIKLLFLALAVSFSGQLLAKQIINVDFDALKEQAYDFNQPFLEQSAGDDLQMRRLSKKFALVHTSAGQPLAVFDLTMNHMGFWQIVLGSIGIKDLSLKGFLKKRKCARKVRRLASKVDNDGKEKSIPECKEGKEADFWKELELDQDWANKQSDKTILVKSENGNYKFKHSTFNLSNLRYKDSNASIEIEDAFRMMAETLYPAETFDKSDIKEFMKEFEMRYDKEKHSYDMVWNREARGKKKKAKLPGFVMNYMNPVANLQQRFKYKNIEAYATLIKNRFWPYGVVAYMFIARVSDQLVNRMEYHENQFLGLLEAAERFEWDPQMPAVLTDLSVDILYLNKVRKPQYFTDGAMLRRSTKAYQEKAADKVGTRLSKRSDKMSLAKVGGGKWIVARHKGKKDGEFKGIYAAGVKPELLTRRVTMNVNAKTPVFKYAERVVVDTAGLLAHTFIRTYYYIKLGPINFGVSLPRDIWWYLTRKRMNRELALEGELVGLIDAAKEGAYNLGLSSEELDLARRRLAATHINVYETRLSKEDEVINKNLEILKKALKAPGAKELFHSKHMVPVSL